MATADIPRTADYQLGVVWSTGTDADTSAYDQPSYLTPPGIVIDGLGRAQQRAFAPPGMPALDVALPNQAGTYSPGGGLGSFVGRGPAATVDVVDWGSDVLVDATDVLVDADTVLVDGRVDVRLFTGAIDTATQDIDQANAQVQIRALGSISLLADRSPTIALSENIRTDQAITAILDAVGWDASGRVIDTGDTTLLYFWANGSQSAMALILAILGAEGVPACVYEDRQGRFHFEGRQYRQNAARSATVQWTLVDTAPPQGSTALRSHVVPSRWASNPDEVVAAVHAVVNVRTPTSTQKIWEYGGPLVLSSGETRDIEATSSDPFKSAVVPVSGTDYTVSVGSPLTSISLLETSGQWARIRLVAPAGGCTVIGVTSNGIQLRAVSLPVTTMVPVTSTVNNALDAARFRPKDYTISHWPEITANDALQNANNFARRYQRPRDQMAVQLVNLDFRHLSAILDLQPSDRIQIQHTHASIDAAFFVEQLHHDLSAGGGLHRLVLGCERVTDDQPARFGSARFHFDQFSE
jgi:hypothetical protein